MCIFSVIFRTGLRVLIAILQRMGGADGGIPAIICLRLCVCVEIGIGGLIAHIYEVPTMNISHQ